MPEETSVASSSESAEEKPCSSTAAAAGSSVEVLEEAKKLIGTGKRHLVMGDVVSAVNVFQEACSMLAEKYGDTADECGEAFFLCGKSLLELARMENSVLGNALEGVPEESEEEEQPSSSNVESPDNLDDDDDDDEDGEKNGQDKEEEEVGNLQLAWEMLEVAKVIYKRKESTEDQLMAAQAYLKLGEVSAESGNYPQALDDFQECLALQLKYLPPHIRLLAETHYHVATTLCYMDQYSQAIQHYNSSIKVIETRLAMLQEVIDAAEGTDGAAEEKNELDELKLLLPDIREKVEDAKESQKTASAASQAIQQTLGGASTSSAFLCENGSTSSAAFATTSQVPVKTESASSSKAVSDISHLVRKKRKPEDESPVKDTDAKQAKQEATVNGSGDSSASNGNGVQEGKSQESATQSASVESPA
ncbi:histone-binding protein N1/N2-like isoform X11 [Simochromis diagramma]|uniref:histone-binding protein N1/N2-like isoform X11 n=1 Tax=Simochromis diagramma TaxID=43689 RepID=UPI001A7EF805|nr:histone-binding protein N1/N2-like isoform X11 [Simochromis diagramma]